MQAVIVGACCIVSGMQAVAAIDCNLHLRAALLRREGLEGEDSRAACIGGVSLPANHSGGEEAPQIT